MSYVFIFIGVIQVTLQGFGIKRLVSKLGEEKLIILGPLLLAVGIVLTPLLASITGFGVWGLPSGAGIWETPCLRKVSNQGWERMAGSGISI